MLFNRETRLDRLFAGPVLAVRLAFDKDLQRMLDQYKVTTEYNANGFNISVAVPAQPDGFCSFSLFQTAEVQLEIFVVEVDGGDSYRRISGRSWLGRLSEQTRILWVKFLVRVKD